MRNKTLIFKRVPDGAPVAGVDLVVEDRPIELAAPPGGLVVQVLHVSLDPYLRLKMRPADVKSYSDAFALDGPVREDSVARVVASDSARFREGDVVLCQVPVAEYVAIESVDSAAPVRGLAAVRRVVDDGPGPALALPLFLGPLGMPGLTAYEGLYGLGRPRAGETLFVSSAAGAGGQLVGQMARREGLRVVGSVGSPQKRDFVVSELGFDDAFVYKDEKAADALPRLAPAGIDIYFDNVGGEQLDAALLNMNQGGRVVICGMVRNHPPSSFSFLSFLSFIFSIRFA